MCSGGDDVFKKEATYTAPQYENFNRRALQRRP
jgi:hypothetical protein